MRLHELSVTAFGPFVETVEVDFDELGAGGLFLLTGDTGSGKTSVLDAVCFALYGEVPGDRHAARHLRSDHADPAAEPRVVLRVSIGPRTFRFTRSPAWERPKRRGSGTTRIHAHVVVEEHRSGEWTTLTNRLDEAGQLVIGLLGMTCTQFTQVAMLPQGRFQAFLRASSAERHAVLQRLFRTRRYEDVERWLVERRVELRRRCQAHQEVCAGVVNRLQEADASRVPDDWDLHDLDQVAGDGSLERWAASRLMTAARTLEHLVAELDAATTALAADQEALDDARAALESRTRGEQARLRLQALEETAVEATAIAEALDADRRAAPVLPLARRAEAAETAYAEAETAVAGHVDRLCALLEVDADRVDGDLIERTHGRLTEARAVAESWLPREREVEAERRRVASLVDETDRLAALLTERMDEADQLARRVAGAEAALAEATTLAARAAADRVAVQDAEQGLEAAAEAAELGAELSEARERLSSATGHAQELRQTYLDLRERRVSGMAAELAGALAAGCSCPVCGSIDHPAPASASTAVSREDEDTARDAYESADFERQAVHELAVTLTTRLRTALVRSGGHTVNHWRRLATTATTAATASAAAERSVAGLRRELDELLARAGDVSTELATARVSLEERSREHAEASERHARLREELEELLAGRPGVTSVSALVASHRSALEELDRARSTVIVRERAAAELTVAARAAEQAAVDAGFATLQAALDAVLPSGLAEQHVRRLEERRAATAAAASVLKEEAVRSALSAERPDVAALTGRVAESSARRDRATADHEQAARRARRLEALVGELGECLSAWAPVRRDHLVAAGLASLVEGKSADNRLRMRLSAYVLSERLREVVAAANERLGTMTDQRFTLEQADERGAGEQRGGLSLRVRDEWSGKQRDPATLSGGETFIVSLALALGLADTVSHEAGGTQLETLFIDEGFGALDATTLDAVMDTLDALRDGGRVVGLVSHVAELRNRVPAQLEVHKARRGSTVRTVVADQ